MGFELQASVLEAGRAQDRINEKEVVHKREVLSRLEMPWVIRGDRRWTVRWALLRVLQVIAG